jgi:hypothetical protein
LRLGAAVVGVALPLAFALPAAAAPPPGDVAAAEETCIALGYDTSTCTEAVTIGVAETIENPLNEELAGAGIDYVVDVIEDPDLTPNSGNPAVPANPNVA